MANHFEMSREESLSLLRQVLPLMTRQHVATIPENYTLWFDHVLRANPDLSAEIDGLVTSGSSFDADRCQQLYQKYFVDPLSARVDGIQDAMRAAMTTVLAELAGLGEDMSQFGDVLETCSTALDGEPTEEDLKTLVVELAREARRAGERSREVEGTISQMSEEMSGLRDEINRLTRNSVTDALTGVANRRAFDDAAARLIEEAARENTSLSLILVDIDRFKVINDTHGHIVGDRVLRFVAREMEQCVKGRDLLARYGGEEFAILLPATPLTGAIMLAESIRVIVEAQSIAVGEGVFVDDLTISLGVARYRAAEDDKEALIARADACLYRSKQLGRNRTTGEDRLSVC